MKMLLKVLLWAVVIVLAIFLVLFLAVQVPGEFDTIGELIQYIVNQVTGKGLVTAPLPRII